MTVPRSWCWPARRPLRRFTIFGNAFRGRRGRDPSARPPPTMSRHPTTPMHEADLRAHLAAQPRHGVADEPARPGRRGRRRRCALRREDAGTPRHAPLRRSGRRAPADGRSTDLAAGATPAAVRRRILRRRLRLDGPLAGDRHDRAGPGGTAAHHTGEAAAGDVRQRLADDGATDRLGGRARVRHPPCAGRGSRERGSRQVSPSHSSIVHWPRSGPGTAC